MRIAVLEDDHAHAQAVQSALQACGYECFLFTDGKALMQHLHRASYDLFILDWHVPGMEGPEVARWLRRHDHQLQPILMLTSRDDERDIVEGLEAGADDYMVKPIRIAELQARVRAQLRRAYPQAQLAPSTFGAYRFDTHRREVFHNDQLVELKPKEFDLALFLFRNTGRLLTYDHLLEELWGRSGIDTRTISTHISQLRRKLDLRPANGVRLNAVYGVGYRFEREDEPAPPSGT